MNNELAIVESVDQLMPSAEVLVKIKSICDVYVSTGALPPGYKNGADLMVVALRGRELGVSLGQAIQGMFPMKGRLGYMGGFLLSVVKTKLPSAEIRIKESSKEKCVLEFRRAKEDEYQTEEFSMQEVESCNYNKNPVKDKTTGYQKTDASGHAIWELKGPWGDPKNMLYWRCVSRTVNRHFPDVFGSQVYTADELSDADAIDVPFSPATRAVSSVPYETEKKEPVLKVVDPLPPAVTEIEEAVIVSKQEDHQPKPPQEPATVEPVASSKMNQKTIDLLVSQFEKDIYQAKDKRSVDDVFDTFKKTGVPGKVLTNCFNIKNQRKEELK